MSSIWYTVTSKTVSSNSMLNNIELRVKRGVKWGVNGVIASPIIISSHPHPTPPPQPPTPWGVRFQFSNLDNIDSMLPYFFDDPVFDVNCFSPVFKFPSPVKSVNCFKLADDVIKLVDHVIDLR